MFCETISFILLENYFLIMLNSCYQEINTLSEQRHNFIISAYMKIKWIFNFDVNTNCSLKFASKSNLNIMLLLHLHYIRTNSEFNLGLINIWTEVGNGVYTFLFFFNSFFFSLSHFFVWAITVIVFSSSCN